MSAPNNNPKKPLNSYIKYSAYVFQMAATILICVLLGKYIDGKMGNEKLIVTAILSVSFMFLKALLITIFLLIANNTSSLTKVLMLNFALIYLAYLFYSMHACLKTLNFYQK